MFRREYALRRRLGWVRQLGQVLITDSRAFGGGGPGWERGGKTNVEVEMRARQHRRVRDAIVERLWPDRVAHGFFSLTLLPVIRTRIGCVLIARPPKCFLTEKGY